MEGENGRADFSILGNMTVILTEPTHLGNVGSAARAMRTMGLSRLRVVTAAGEVATPEALALAKGGAGILRGAELFGTLDEALSDVALAAAASARLRSVGPPLFPAREAAEKIVPHLRAGTKCALVFGRESSGLTNDELLKCDMHVRIDADPEYSSLNLAMSVQVLAYELRQAVLREPGVREDPGPDGGPGEPRRPSHADMEAFYAFIEQNLRGCGFLKPNHNGAVMGRIRRVFAKADLTARELSIIRGSLASAIRHAGGRRSG